MAILSKEQKAKNIKELLKYLEKDTPLEIAFKTHIPYKCVSTYTKEYIDSKSIRSESVTQLSDSEDLCAGDDVYNEIMASIKSILTFHSKSCEFCKDKGHEFGEGCKKYMAIHEEAKKVRDLWKNNHCSCPACGNESMGQTLAGPIQIVGEPYSDDVNHAFCDCGWKGMVNELKPKEEKLIQNKDKRNWNRYFADGTTVMLDEEWMTIKEKKWFKSFIGLKGIVLNSSSDLHCISGSLYFHVIKWENGKITGNQGTQYDIDDFSLIVMMPSILKQV